MQVEPTGKRGIYQVTGRTNLPEQTQFTIQAIRGLQASQSSSQTKSAQTYSILARTQAKVEKGKWQATLNLLQSGDQGELETWQQSNESLNLQFQPENQVRFLATTNPTEDSIELQQRSDSPTQDAQTTSVQFTADGKSYLQTEQFLTIDPPVAKLASRQPVQTTVRVAVQPINKTTDVKQQTDAGLAIKEWMR